MDPQSPSAPPVTLEGWYALHQAFAVDHRALRQAPPRVVQAARGAAAEALERLTAPPDGGWSAVVGLVGSLADVLLIHFRPTFDELADVQTALARLTLCDFLRPTFAFVSVAEVALYDLAGDAAVNDAAVNEAAVNDAADAPADARRTARLAAERASPHTQRRLQPPVPGDLPYVSFYPTSKRRDATHNWYVLPLDERRELMRHHALTGRRHAGRVRQVITGATGLGAWEWGVTLFADDPLTLKRVVTDLRYDAVSARYADFGDFYVGRVVAPRRWALALGT